MNQHVTTGRSWLTLVVALAWLSSATPSWAAEDIGAAAEEAGRILQAAGVQGGLIVHLDCGDGRLTAALRASESYVVHGLDGNAASVAKAREHVRSLGVYGRVSVDEWSGSRLPYVDNLVNLLVSSNGLGGMIQTEEVMRVLAPGGVLCVKVGDEWKTTVKPWPEEIDEWTHYLHDATNNAVARDTVVGPPKHYQWIGSPEWLRHHDHLSGFSAMVSAKGRLFTILDMGPRWSVQMPPKWMLVARDAFNGTVLWERPIDTWHAHLWPLKRGPAGLMRRLVAEGDTVYVTLGVGEPVTALDAATGRTLRTFEGSEGAEEMILSGGVLFVLVNPELDAYKDLPRESVDALRRAGRDWRLRCR
ncbi:MAG: class I SAM-dependent methyltransferase [Planctomycetota bacterium]